MKHFLLLRRFLPAVVIVASSMSTANAGLIYSSGIFVSAQGFGSAPRLLTVQAGGQDNGQSGCAGFVGGVFTVGPASCIADSSVFDPENANSITNLGGQEASPLGDNQKHDAPLLSAAGIQFADQIGIIFNATEPGGGSITVNDLTLKFFDATNAFVGAIELGTPQTFASTNPGNGSAGFVFVVDALQLGAVDALLTLATRITVESTTSDFGGGPDSFRLINIAPGGDVPQIPEPATYLMLGGGLAVLGVLRSKKQ